MILLLSPSKTLDFEPIDWESYSMPRFLEASEQLVGLLRKKKAQELQDLMDISEKLAVLNAQRYQAFGQPFTLGNAKQAVWAFQGDVYTGLQASTWDEQEVDYAQRHLRILSGLYGLLRPLDLIQPYRLEMGAPLPNKKGKDLYAFWGERLTDQINADAEEAGAAFVLNLASQEYFRAVQPDKLRPTLIKVDFRERRKDAYKVISFHAKKARGAMARLVIESQLETPDQLTELEVNGYQFNPELSDGRLLTFTLD